MTGTQNGENLSTIIKQIKSALRKTTPHNKDLPLLESFAERYFNSCAVEDLKARSIEDLCKLFLSHWELLHQRKPQEAKIRVFNPDEKKEGWHSTHTIIQVSHDDIPFLVDSIRMELNRYDYEMHFIIHFGGLKIKRDKHHRMTEVLPVDTQEQDASTEAPIYIEIDRLTDQKAMDALQEDIDRVLKDVSLAVADWKKMVARVKEILNELENKPPKLDVAEVNEAKDFLHWLVNNNFTFLGARNYKAVGEGQARALQLARGTGLGVLREEGETKVSKSYDEMPPQARKIALSKNTILIIAKTKTLSTVHRKDYTDLIAVKEFNEKGEVVGEKRFIGLYTSVAYHTSPRQIPFLRLKVSKVLEELRLPPDSHDGKEAAHILETLPRDDLFQATAEELYGLTLSIIQLQERKKIRLLVRRDAYHRYFSCLVFVPREIFNTELARTFQEILSTSFKGEEPDFTTYFSDSVLARIHYLIRVNPKSSIDYDINEIEKKLQIAARSWINGLKDNLIAHYGEAEGLKFYTKYSRAFSASYMEFYSPEETITDIEKIESLSERPLALHLSYSRENVLRLKLYQANATLILSDVLPILENMGLRIIDERSTEIKPRDNKNIWVNDFDMTYDHEKIIDLDKIRDIFKEAFTQIWFGMAENDRFNWLVLSARLTWQETAMLRAYTKYLRQTGFTFSQSYIEQALIKNPDITISLVELFKLRFDPSLQQKGAPDTQAVIRKIETALELVTSLDEDRILRRLLEVIQATIRTNYFQPFADNSNKPYISLKFDPEAISDLPLPRPKFEIFVYSPRVEGIHLRAGKVARGGIRWSDRREDFRTEVLGLMKAQQVKNTLIVPTGAKGGFFVKMTPTPEMSRDAYLKEGIECYSIYIRGLLDITDNIKDGRIIPPKNVVRYDEDDPYLVVAADKGTATFSDTANRIAQEYGFWLDDAFASGGSAGYDHKKMGITSRGVWVSVERHFRELGIDPNQDEFTVVGIGDMAGDVFGNGMLLSKHIKLIGAFNHLHIFIDPHPNAEKTYEERERLFNLPRSNWTDFNPELISAGGGVFNRSAKSIKISPEMKTVLNIEQDYLVPNELIRALIKAPVDLIWNGGIGTFVKSSQENHLDVGDKSNDAIRVNANEIHARAIAEGGNLGVTQLARIEYSLNGGIINTDFIDNSAGVNCSDHEVNIKILLNKVMSDGLLTREQRNKLLEKMTQEVAELVLTDNYEQAQMLSLEASVSHHTLDLFRQYMNDLEKKGRLNRTLEFLPDDKALIERKANNKPLTRPEIAMLLAYCKMFLKQDILASNIPDDDYFVSYLMTAFPHPLRQKYLAQMREHSLRREIIATQVCKAITDRMGISFAERLQRETGSSSSFVVRAFVIAENIYHMEDMWQQIKGLDYKVSPGVQYEMMLQIYYLIRRSTRWFLRNRKADIDIEETITHFEPMISSLIKQLPKILDEQDKEILQTEAQALIAQGVPDKLARNIASCNVLFTSLDIVEAAKKYNLELADVAKTYYILGNRLELNWIRELMNSYVVANQWDELARAGFRDDLDRVQRKLAVRVLSLKIKDVQGKTIEERIDIWIKRCQFLLDRWQTLLMEIKASENVGFITYSVVLRELFDFAQAA